MDKENKMLLGKAFYILRNIESAKFTETEKVEALRRAMDAVTINAITKEDLRRVIKYLLRHTITREEYLRRCSTNAIAYMFCSFVFKKGELVERLQNSVWDENTGFSASDTLNEIKEWLQEPYWDDTLMILGDKNEIL